MLVKIKDKETQIITYVTMNQITIVPMNDSFKIKFYSAVDHKKPSIVLTNLSASEVTKIEEAIHQDFIIDLTNKYDDYMRTKTPIEDIELPLPLISKSQSHTR